MSLGVNHRRLVLSLALAASVGACVTQPVYAPPWYDLDQAWVNDDLGGWAPRRAVDRDRLARAAYARERRWAVEKIEALKRRLAQERRVVREATRARRALARRHAKRVAKVRRQRRPKARRKKTAEARAPVRAAARSGGSARRRKRSSKHPPKAARASAGRRRPRTRRHKTARGEASPHRAVRPEATRVAQRPVLGDGTVRSELLAGARRLLGLEAPLSPGDMLRHLLVVAAAPLRVRAPAGRFLAAAWEAAREAGRAREPQGYRPRPGDIALFDGVADVDGDGRPGDPMSLVAVVEEVRPSGVIVCIGEVGGVVRRFHMDPRRPWVVRDERAGETVNDPLRPRSLTDSPGAPVLAGALLAGYLSF